MAYTLPRWAIGKHITAFTLSPCVPGTDGVLTELTASAYAMVGHLQDVSVELSTNLENISSMDRPYENNVPIEYSATYKCTELEKHTTTDGGLVADAFFNYTYYKVYLRRGANLYTGYGVISNYTMNASKPRVTGSFELKMIDVGNSTATFDLTTSSQTYNPNPSYS